MKDTKRHNYANGLTSLRVRHSLFIGQDYAISLRVPSLTNTVHLAYTVLLF